MCFRIHSFLMSCEKSLSFMVYMYIITCKSVHGIKPLQCRECVVAQPRCQRSLLPVPKEREREPGNEVGCGPFCIFYNQQSGSHTSFHRFNANRSNFL